MTGRMHLTGAAERRRRRRQRRGWYAGCGVERRAALQRQRRHVLHCLRERLQSTAERAGGVGGACDRCAGLGSRLRSLRIQSRFLCQVAARAWSHYP